MSAETHQSFAQPLTYATVCSGIECMSVAATGLPLRPVFFSEIEPFPCAVLKARYPHVPNLGDMSKIECRVACSADGLTTTEITNGTTRIRLSRPLDILAGGTPCQDVSIAGRRAGMASGSGTRSSLAFDFVRLARDIRPRFLIWENVAGCIDSKNAPDFLRFADALVQCGYNLAYRVLDAQYVRVDGVERAVPQRRRRVWLVGCLGDGLSLPAQILFESDRATGHTPPRRRTGQGFARPLADRDTGNARLVGDAAGCAADAIALDGDKLKPRTDPRAGGNGFGVGEDGAGYTLTATDRHGVAYGYEHYEAGGVKTPRRECEPTLRARTTTNGVALAVGFKHKAGAASQSPIAANGECLALSAGCHDASVALCYDGYHQTAKPELCFTLRSAATGAEGNDADPKIAYGVSVSNSDISLGTRPAPECAQTVRSCPFGQGGVFRPPSFLVRRLTPVECERLMCLPDGYTVPTGLHVGDPELVSEFQRIFDAYGEIMAAYSGKPAPKPKTAAAVAKWLAAISDPATCPDSPRYKACGNDWATNQPRWILLNLLAALGIDWQTPYAPGPSESCSPTPLTPHPSAPQPCA